MGYFILKVYICLHISYSYDSVNSLIRITLKQDLKESQEQAERYKMKMAEQNSVSFLLELSSN